MNQESQTAASTEQLATTEVPAQSYTVDLQKVMEHLQSTEPSEFEAAARQLTQLAELDPHNGMVLMGLGISHARRQQWQPAMEMFERAAKAAPKYAPVYVNLGNLYRQFGRKKEARVAYDKAIELQPGFADAHYNLSLLNEIDGKPDDAEVAVRRALLFRPNYPEAHNNLGHLLIKAGKVEQALSHFRQALAWAPNLLPAQFNLILALYRLGRSTEAQAEVDRVLAADPDNAQVLRVQSAGLMQMGMLDAAETVNSRLLALNPEAPDLRMNHAEVLLARGDAEGAIAIYRQLLNQRLVPPAVGMGAMANAMRVQRQFSEAKNLYQQALMMDNRLPALVIGLARVLVESGEVPLGLASWRRAVQMLPQAADVHAELVNALRFDADAGAVARKEEVAKWTVAHVSAKEAAEYRRAPHRRKEGEELRVGIVLGTEPDAVTLCSVLALLAHKGSEIGLFLYHAGTVAGPALQPVHEAAAFWRPVGALGKADFAEQIRQDAVDVLIDTVGWSSGSKLSALALHPAPLQLSWLSDCSVGEVPGIDGMLVNAALAGNEQLLPLACPGRVLALPSLGVWQPPRVAANEARPHPQCCVLGVLSPLSHISVEVVDAWAELLLALPDATLLVASPLSGADESVRNRLRRLFMLRDVASDRIGFESVSDTEDLSAVLARMTVVLDSFPVSMGLHSSLCSLWMGVPIATLKGPEVWQRWTYSVLCEVGLEDWVAESVESYIELVLTKLRQPEVLLDLRQQLPERLQSGSMMDRAAFVAGFEQTLLSFWDQSVPVQA